MTSRRAYKKRAAMPTLVHDGAFLRGADRLITPKPGNMSHGQAVAIEAQLCIIGHGPA